MNEGEKIIAILKYLKIQMKNPVKDYTSRFIIQKITFITQQLGISLSFSFTLYYHGPYCPTLAQLYYTHPIEFATLKSNYELSIEEQAILDSIQANILNHGYYQEHPDDVLEACATIFYLRSAYKLNEIASENQLLLRTKQEKPHLSSKTMILALNSIKKMEFKKEFLNDQMQDEINLWDSAEE